MAMTSSTWTFDLGGRLTGVGIDAESVSRFGPAVPGESLLPLVFSEREARHFDGLPDPARGYCAAFCAKEAFFKATGVPMDPRACRLWWEPGREKLDLDLDDALVRETGVARALARVAWDGDACVVEVYAIGRDA
jgi:phosphopantetheinyl transferase